MANQGAKKRLEENAKRMALLWKVAFIPMALHLVVRLLVLRSSATWLNYVAAGASALLQLFCYGVLKSAAEPTYGPGGELLDGGADLRLGGVSEYCADLLYVCAGVQLAGVATDWAWMLLLAVPAFAAYKLWVHVIAPWVFAPDPEPVVESEADRKRREKAERKAARGRVVYR